MTTARADLVNLTSAVANDGDTVATIASFGTGATLAGVTANAALVTADANATRRYRVKAVGGQIWVAFGLAPDAGVEPRGLVTDGDSIMITLLPTHSIKVAAAALS